MLNIEIKMRNGIEALLQAMKSLETRRRQGFLNNWGKRILPLTNGYTTLKCEAVNRQNSVICVPIDCENESQ